MLSLDELRQALNRPDLSDEQVTQGRDFLYWLADQLIDDYLAESDRSPPNTHEAASPQTRQVQ
jgi:hypothetical protein